MFQNKQVSTNGYPGFKKVIKGRELGNHPVLP